MWIVFFGILLNASLWSFPKISGFSDTSFYIYGTENEDLSGTETYYRGHESIVLDIDFSQKLSFHTNNRVTYRSNTYEDEEQVDLNLFYGYIDYQASDKLGLQCGRIMDVSNLSYTYYDGGNIEYRMNVSKNRFTLDVYGGLIVNDDYLEDENYPYGFNSFDYRNFLIEQRTGDYLGGTKVNLFSRGIGIFTLNYQMLYNEGALAEQYASFDFDTLFSRRVKFYGYGTYDLIEPSPANMLAAAQVNPLDSLSLIMEYEYIRPVYIKDSYFWSYFEPYGSQEVSALIIYSITPAMILDLKYGRIFYEADGKQGDEVSGSFEHRELFGFGVKLTGEYITGPEGERALAQIVLKRKISLLNILAGGGTIFYYEDELASSYSQAYFALLGADMNILTRLLLSATGEYYNNPKYAYDVRGLISAKYLF